MPHKHVCSCGAPQIMKEPLTLSRSENKGGLKHEFEEVFNVWKCEFCGKKENFNRSATRISKGISSPRKPIVNQYASALVRIPRSYDHIRIGTFIKILEDNFPERSPSEILEDMLLEGIVQIDYTMKNANRDSFIPRRVRLNPTFESEIKEVLDNYRGIESVDEKIKRVKELLSTVNYEQSNNPQSKRILAILKIQENLLLKGETPYFDCETKKCIVKKDNDRYEILLKILLALLETVRNGKIIVSSDFYCLTNLNNGDMSEYRSDIESILGERLIFFGVLKNIEPLYILPSRIPTEVSIEIERFETDLRSFIMTNLLNYYTSIDIVIFRVLENIFGNKAWDNINSKMIEDLESDYDKTKDSNIKNAINITKNLQLYDQLLITKFFEAMVFGHIIKIIEHEWDMIFSKCFNYLNKEDALTKLKIIKSDRNIQSHRKSTIPTTFKTLTHIYEFKTSYIYGTFGVNDGR